MPTPGGVKIHEPGMVGPYNGSLEIRRIQMNNSVRRREQSSAIRFAENRRPQADQAQCCDQT